MKLQNDNNDETITAAGTVKITKRTITMGASSLSAATTTIKAEAAAAAAAAAEATATSTDSLDRCKLIAS